MYKDMVYGVVWCVVYQIDWSVPTHACGLVCHSLLQGTIKLTFADQHSLRKDHLDAYKPKPEIKGSIRCGVRCSVVWCGVWYCVWVVWCVFAECRAVDVPRACPTLNCPRCGFYTVADAPPALSSEPLPVRASPSLLLRAHSSLLSFCVSAASLQRTREAPSCHCVNHVHRTGPGIPGPPASGGESAPAIGMDHTPCVHPTL